jgi:hypothetical protein
MKPPIPNPVTPPRARRPFGVMFWEARKWLLIALVVVGFTVWLVGWVTHGAYLSGFYVEIK